MGTETETTDVVESTTLLTGSDETDNPETDAAITEDVAEETGTEEAEGYTDFTLPEGVTMDEAVMTKASELFKNANLSQEQAQAFVDFQVEQNQANASLNEDAFANSQKEWVSQVKADGEIGGDKFNESVTNAKAALDKFGTPELTKMLNESGMGSNPELIRLLSRVGVLTREDNPDNNQTPPSTPRSAEEILYN